jgi:hypothetical protein
MGLSKRFAIIVGSAVVMLVTGASIAFAATYTGTEVSNASMSVVSVTAMVGDDPNQMGTTRTNDVDCPTNTSLVDVFGLGASFTKSRVDGDTGRISFTGLQAGHIYTLYMVAICSQFS